MTAELKRSAAKGAPARSWKPYPAYKDSGVEWLGKVPEHWDIIRLKHLAGNDIDIVQTGPFGAQLHASDYVEDGVPLILIRNVNNLKIDDSDIPKITKDKAESLSIYRLQIGDIVFSRVGSIGRIAIVTEREKGWLISGQMLRIRIKNPNLINDFSLHVFCSDVISEFVKFKSVGSTRDSINTEILRNIPVPIPPLPEQRAISIFLDDRTRKIDSLIEKKQKMIELLKEERAAVINQAVTKGLNPDAPMKDSGIGWLGEVPEKWGVKKLKYIAEVVLGKMLTNDDKGGYFYKPYLRAQNIGLQKVNSDDIKQMWFSEKELDQYRVKLNDLLVSEGGEVGRTAIWKNIIEECYIQNSVHKVTMLDGNNPYYFLYLFFLYGQLGYFDSIVSRVSIAHLTREKLKEVFCLIPSIGEQEHIVKHIESESTKIDSAISIIEKELLLLQEYRTGLISEVVTGKIDVRGE
jgi:restriction endonuclease S subunit